jgi:hypothetical protein
VSSEICCLNRNRSERNEMEIFFPISFNNSMTYNISFRLRREKGSSSLAQRSVEINRMLYKLETIHLRVNLDPSSSFICPRQSIHDHVEDIHM